MSFATPRPASARYRCWAVWRRCAPSGITTSRSTSLCGPIWPRAADPNRNTRRGWTASTIFETKRSRTGFSMDAGNVIGNPHSAFHAVRLSLKRLYLIYYSLLRLLPFRRLHFGVGDADGGHAVAFIVDFDIVEDVGAFFLQDAADFHRQHSNLCVGVRAAAQFQEVPPGAAVAGDKDFGFGGVGKNRTGGLPGPLAAVARSHLGLLFLDVLAGSLRQLGVGL